MEQDNNKLYNPNWAKHGYIQVYTGDGKGKTTASLGLCLRALGRNWKVLLVMFTKGGSNYGELVSFKKLSNVINDNLTVVQAGLDRIVYSDNITKNDNTEIINGWKIVKEAIRTNAYNLIIMDEANIALDLGILDVNEVVETLKNKPEEMEIVLTGRNAKPEIIEIAHLVSNIDPIKHYWDTGVAAREGIEY